MNLPNLLIFQLIAEIYCYQPINARHTDMTYDEQNIANN